MTYFIKQKFLERYSYSMVDQDNVEAYVVKTNVISLKKKWFILDVNDKLLARVENLLFTFPPKHKAVIESNDLHIDILRKYKFIKHYYSIQIDDTNFYVTRNIFSKKHKIFNGEKQIGEIKTNPIYAENRFDIEVIDANFEMLVIIMSAIICDYWNNKSWFKNFFSH